MTSDKPGMLNGKDITVSFQTLGCKVNRYETDAMRQAFASQGFRIVSGDEKADVFVINTCTVTSEADRKSRQMIRRAKRRNPEALVVAMGCQTELLKSISEADISVGTQNRRSIMDKVLETLGLEMPEPEHPKNAVPETAYQEFGSVLSQEDTRAYIKIEDGCDSFCSYCIIPYARGRVVSRLPEDVLREAVELGERGFHEIVLTGIHICNFGKDRGEGIEALQNLLMQIDHISTIHRIRLGSLEPNSLTKEFIQCLAQIRKLCPHFHISLQSGSDSVLSRMNRKYDTNEYRTCISFIRSCFRRAAISTDIIVAFPGETESEHEESLRFCKEIGFSHIHVFPFSERFGTRAADMTPKIPSEISAKRTDDFLRLSTVMTQEFFLTFVGEKVDVLLESSDLYGGFSGYCKEYLRVRVAPGPCFHEGSEVRVQILSTDSNELYGTITD